MREIEFEPSAEFRAEVGLAVRVVNKANLARFGLEIVAQQVTQNSARDNEALSIALGSKTCAPVTFVTREANGKAGTCLRRNVQTGAPTVNVVGCQLKGAR